MVALKRHIIRLFVLLLLLGGTTNEAWAYKVTYHILTLPMTSERPGNTKSEYYNWRMEAVRVVVDDASNVVLDDHFKSPLAMNFKYYAEADVTQNGTAQAIYANNTSKYYLYKIKGEDTPTTEDDVTPLAEGADIPSNDYHVYVTYEYNPDNGIAKLDGSETYNITIGDGFLAYNRGRNNRPAVIPKQYVSAEQLTNDDFVYVDVSKVSGLKDKTYWADSKNKNDRNVTQSRFFFQFKYLGEDPYNITIAVDYKHDTYYIEKDENKDIDYVRKYYKDARIFGQSTGTLFLASDFDKKYKTVYNTEDANNNPTKVEYYEMPGYHRNYKPVWNSFAMLSSHAIDGNKNGYVFMGTKTFKSDGSYEDPGKDKNNNYQYFYLKSDYKDLNYAKMTPANAVKSYSTDDKMYEIATVNFHVTTPFYNPSGTVEDKAAHTLTAPVEMSEYSLATENISDDDIPASLKRKYCNINGYYKDAAHTQKITKYSDLGESRDIYLGYDLLADIPFKAITPAASYTAATWSAATWYELTDDGSIQETGKKIKTYQNGGNYKFKNNGADGEYVKASEFAFIGDPYELRVISRSQTSGATPSYLGAAGTPDTGTDFTASTTATAGYLWQIPYDATSGSFLLQLFKGTGHWYWDAGHLSKAITYGTDDTYNVPNSNSQTITFNISGLTVADGNYIKVTKGGTDETQVIETSPTLSTGIGAVSSDGKATVTATIKARGDGNKTFTLTITEYNSSNVLVGTATVVTINQNEAAVYAGDDDVKYSTSASTRIKVLELPKRTYTYKIVDKSGRIAVKATASQTIYSPLSQASIPSIIVSPFLVGETLTFYDSYTNRNGDDKLSRLDFHNDTEGASEQPFVTETPNADHDIFVTYTTAHLDEKPIKLSEDHEFYVNLNGQYLYFDPSDNSIKSSAASVDNNNYKWKLRQRDPYAMLIDNVGAREYLPTEGDNVANQTETPTIYDDNGGTTTPTRQMGAWVKLAGDLPTTSDGTALVLDTDRANAQPFIAKSSGTSGIYEVMVATGDGEGAPDASTTYYNIGRLADNTVKIYNNTTYAHGDDVLEFKLEVNTIIKYHLIDKSKKELIQVTSKNLDLTLPHEYISPLVSTYHYWQASAFVDADPDGGTDFNFTDSPTEISSVAELTDAKYDAPVSSTEDAWNNPGNNKMTATTEENMIAQVKLISTPGTYIFRIGSGSYTYKSVTVTEGQKNNADIYVTYDTDEQFIFGTTSPYTLKFLNGKSYKLEDGNDKLTKKKMKAMYPYCNGDGHLNIYGQESNEEQMSGGSSTRPRWIWFFESENRDPYHVKIHSRSTISFNGDNSTYLQTYAVHFNQDTDPDAQHIVTGANLAGISRVPATEYMILGEKIPDGATKYKLLTTDPINGERRYVTSFEQYWKTYNMLKQHVLGINVNEGEDQDLFSENPETFVMPQSKWPELKEKLSVFQETATDDSDYATQKAALNSIGVYYFRIGEAESYTYKRVTVTAVSPSLVYTEDSGSFATEWANALDINRSTELNYVDGCVWHSYSAVASAVRWNGNNTETTKSKVVEELEHWFQTFDMGDGTFEIESADIPPVLVLLDLHGWEIMRKTLPTGPDPEKIAALKVYDSPMVEEYKFYNNATKASGCHKYTLRLDSNNKERDQIKVDGKHFTSTSLGTLPPMKADKYGTYSDVYVTYTVKDEYKKSYTYNYDPDTQVETSSASKFLIVINARYARNRIDDKVNYFSKPVSQGTNPTGGNVYDMILSPSQVSVGNVIVDTNKDGKIDNNNLWYVEPNLDIDNEMGIPWATIAGNSSEPKTEAETKEAYKDKTGFDPYNLQIRNADESINTFFTIDLSSTALSNGVWEGTLRSEGITLQPKTTSGFVEVEGYDHTTLKITKQTFMAVSDANGNMQLMPRFDHTKRVDISTATPYYTTLKAPKDHSQKAVVTNNASMGSQTVFLVRPQVFDYHIIDNDGNEALRYKAAGEYSPSIPNKYKSPLATDFKYYSGVTTNVISEAGDFATQWNDAEELYKRTAVADGLIASQANYLPATGDYYYRIGTNPASYTYKKVTVTKVNEIENLFADAGLNADENIVYVRYSYDESADDDGNDILQGKWFTINLAGKDVQADGTLVLVDDPNTDEVDEQGTGVGLYLGSKPDPVNGDVANRMWQWKFLASPTDISSPYYRPVDPYAVRIYNRKANYSNNMSDDPNPMSIGIKVGGKDRFVILSHPNGSYALAVAGLGTYTYSFLNGVNMTAPSTSPASIVEECYQKTTNDASGYLTLKPELALGADAVYYIKINGTEAYSIPEYKKVTVTSHVATDEDCTPEEWEKAYISPGAQLVLNDDIVHNYRYNVITNDASGNKLAISGIQDNAGAEIHDYEPYLPEDIQTPLLNDEDYIYYGSASESSSTYTVNPATQLITLYGLYDDVVYVRYNPYSMDKTNYNVPNKKALVGGKVARDPASQDVAININDGLPYNIIWEDDNMMRANGSAIECSAGQNLSGDVGYTWQFAGNDPYALKIKNKGGSYIRNSESTTCVLNGTAETATPFMLLKKEGWDYGILQVTGGTNRLTSYGESLTSGNPTKFIIFGLSTHKLLYHLVINTSKKTTRIPYRTGDEEHPGAVLGEDPIPGTTQRDLISMSYGVPGDKYQLGSTIMGQTYCVDAGEVSIGDVLKVPNEFNRPNCNFFFYIDNIQSSGDAKFKKGSENDIATIDAMKTSADALTETGDYYYKITSGTIYRKVHVRTAADGGNNAVYEISGSSKEAYDAAATPTAFQRIAASVEAMETDATTLSILGDHYYKINDGASYYKVTKYPIPVDDDDITINVCTAADWTNAVATKEIAVTTEEAMITAANSLSSVGDHYYEVGPLLLYKKVHVTTAKDGDAPAVYTVVDCMEDDWTNAWQDNGTLNDKYKGLKLPVESPRLMSDAGLIGCLVKVNIAYSFNTGLETNAGNGFVTGLNENLWYTFETKNGTTPYLAQYTNAWGLQAKEGRETRYTNDYLWSPLGDVYGFKMYNRYMIKNSGGTENVMTMSSISEGQKLLLHLPDAEYTVGNEVFELLLSNTPGSFRVHPVINNSGTQYYVRKDPSDNYAKLSTTYSEWTYGLDPELLKPYIERVGYVGGLTENAYGDNKTVLDKVVNGTAEFADLRTVQGIVYDDDNIVKYKPGYYRLHSQPGVSGISPVRYASGYLHDIEKTAGAGSTAIPLHFYSRKGTSTTFETLGNGFTYTNATRGPIPVLATEYDPSTIFYFDGAEAVAPANPTSTMRTQGFYVAENSGNGTGTNREKRVVMATSSPLNLTLMDIGGAVLLIHDGAIPANRKYLNFDQSNFFQRTATDVADMNTKASQLTSVGTYYFKVGGSTYKKVTVTTPKNEEALAVCDPVSDGAESNKTDWERAADLYDLKYYHDSPTDDAKWCMEPANNQGLLVETHSGGDGYYYATFCAPYDLKLPINVVKEEVIEKDYYAYICTEWNAQTIHPIKTGGGGKEIPAGTPVIIRTSDTSGSVKLTIPSTPLYSAAVADNVFTGKYLEQLLSTPITSEDMVYAFGLPITGYGIVTTSGDTNGDITNTIAKSQDYTGVGFYINATPNKELSEETGLWAPNNRYVLHNKIYYRSSESSGASAPAIDNAPDFVPVIFGDEEPGEEELQPDGSVQVVGDGCIYDLLGRKVATKEQVEDGTWRERLAPGIYILNGKKFKK